MHIKQVTLAQALTELYTLCFMHSIQKKRSRSSTNNKNTKIKNNNNLTKSCIHSVDCGRRVYVLVQYLYL